MCIFVPYIPVRSLFAEVMDTGEHRGHRFIVLEKCGPTLLNLVNMKSLMPLPRRHVQEIAFQLMQGVACTYTVQFAATVDLFTSPRSRLALARFDPYQLET